MNSKIVGIIVLILVIGGSLGYYFFFSDGNSKGLTTQRIEVRGYIGSEKSNFLDNPQVISILRNRYGLVVDYQKAGSIEMIGLEQDSNIDFLWPSSQVALELFKQQHSGSVKSEIIFNSPIVLYSWARVAQALEEVGLARLENGGYYVVSFPELLSLIEEEADWSQLGLTELYGKAAIISTDPTKSNSGNMFSGLVADMMYGDVVTSDSLPEVLSRVENFFRRLGYMEHSTGILFEQYLSKGIGSYPLIVGYENQIVEFSIMHEDVWPRVKDMMTILYPEPTVWSSHPLIALSESGEKLLEALQDPELQQIAWEQHGFRTGLIGIENDPEILEISGIAQDVTKVIPMPTPEVMSAIIEALSN